MAPVQGNRYEAHLNTNNCRDVGGNNQHNSNANHLPKAKVKLNRNIVACEFDCQNGNFKEKATVSCLRLPKLSLN